MKIMMLGGLGADLAPVAQPASTGIRIAAGIGAAVLVIAAIVILDKSSRNPSHRIHRLSGVKRRRKRR